MTGCVYLVGAGPGDPGLLTVRALELVRAAEVLAHDELVPEAILDLAPPTAERLRVGRRRGAGPVTHRLHPAVLERARAGQRVVRLKAGDPLVFGRGGEEAEELAAAGIPFEIVPGITAALGAAARAGIPLTHRDLASEVTFTTGHDDGQLGQLGHLGQSRGTIVLYMASHNLRRSLSRLVAAGRPPSTPAAWIEAATLPHQRVVTGTLSDLADKVTIAARNPSGLPDSIAAAGRPAAPPPAILLVGEVVRLHPALSWRDRWPLLGRRILVGRARPGPSRIADRLRAAGADVIEAPEVEADPTGPWPGLDDALARRHQHRALVLACRPGVDAVLSRIASLSHTGAAALSHTGAAVLSRTGDPSPPRPAGDLPPIIAVGDDAAAALAAHGIAPAFASRGACAAALEGCAPWLRGGRLLLPTADTGRPSLVAELASLGAEVEAVPSYRVLHRWPALASPPPSHAFELIVLPSSSAAAALLGHGGAALSGIPVAAIGARTEAAARRLGAARVARAAEDDLDALLACSQHLLAPSRPPEQP